MSTNFSEQVIDRFLSVAIVQLGGTVPTQQPIENYEDYTLRCLELIASLLSGGGGGTGIVPGTSTVSTTTIVNSAITTIKIADGAITSAKIQDGSIATGDIADGAITTEKIADGSIGTSDIADNAITTAKIADANITTAKIADANITTVKIADSAITSAKILDGTIATIDIADGAITAAKLAAGAVATASLPDSAITTVKIADSAITSAKILDGTIATIDIADGAITAAKLAAGAVATASLPDSAITTVKIADSAITTDKIATGAVGTTDLADSAVSTAKIANDAITSAKIQDGSIATGDIADGAITAAKLAATAAVKTLNALTGDLILSAGTNFAITTTGNTLTLNASTATASLTAPTNPYPGQVWFNIAGATVSGIPSGHHAVWDGADWIDVGATQPKGALQLSVSAPISALPGAAWQNISGSTLSGVPSGHVAVWGGANWIDTIYTPSTISADGSRIGFLVKFPTFAVSNPANSQLFPTTKSYDTFGGFDLVAGTYTVPASQRGLWLWDVGCSVFNAGVDIFTVFVTVNTTTWVASDILHNAGAIFGAVGVRPLELLAGDILRFYVSGQVGLATLNTGSFYGTRVQQIA
jgi:type IV secretory pathway VirB9-like protein